MGCLVLVLGVGRCAFRPPRVVFVLRPCVFSKFSHFWQKIAKDTFGSRCNNLFTGFSPRLESVLRSWPRMKVDDALRPCLLVTAQLGQRHRDARPRRGTAELDGTLGTAARESVSRRSWGGNFGRFSCGPYTF